MKISCPSCSAKYSIADEKVQDRLAKIRCRKCSATIVIDGKVSPANVYTTSGEADAAHEHAPEPVAGGAEYSVDFGEGDQRNLPLAELVAAYSAGQVTGETYVWADGFPDWKMINDVPEIVEALGGAAPAAAAAPAPAARAAVRTTGRAGAADLFGRIESAGSEEEEVATSAPDAGAGASAAAAAPSPFGGGGGGGGFGASAGSSTGARNESSVLFSLSALTAGASKPAATTASKPAAAATATEKEDSGLIDLKALTAAATKSDTAAAGGLGAPLGAPLAAPLAAPPLGVAAPLGLGSPLGGSSGLAAAVDYSMPQPKKSNAGLFIGGGVVVAALIIAFAVILKPADAPPAAAAAETTAPVATTAPAPAPSPTTEELTAKPPATGVAAEGEAPDAGAKATAKAGYVSKKGAAAPAKKSGAAAPAAEPAAAPPPPKKKNPCGCASGDLQCNMRCAAGG
ncbi:MAG TPA: zinc-ribbon domain-containing protein [Polyangiaceae bacterium]|nr:zinc-ribbon domain-containing protein [Polyangiaceae bacterium]